ncbi:hypothetical protein QTH91_01135 [Variovorax dokdonensis]|uniref:Uncharacterized protein n=1 Tax=Variovorax dokdonensis TaxID=344883 RepID=A0ABT7N555_9BURK|nr:hypothetical protein [Variovorax dokdonensis]MDM0043074.1 hypothetical protein [Variovorax dokdonensis]
MALRNDIVHNLLERFDLWLLEGCSAADAHLEQSYGLVDRHMDQLLAWARGMNEAAHATTSFMATSEYREALFAKEPETDGATDHALSELSEYWSVAERLKEAEAFLAVEGSEEAMAFVARVDAEESPSRYRRKSWRQILSGCGILEMQRIALPERAGLHTVFRSKRRA